MSIEVKGLVKQYGTQLAVNNITFSIPKGKVVGFLGPNGAGKSTTMKMLTSYVPPTSGSASICGFDVVKDAMEVRKRVGYLPEGNPLYYDMYVKEYLNFAAGIHQLSNKTARINDVIEMTGLGKEMHKKIGQLSKGYKQRVGIAQAMIHDPEVLILDEPTSGLDPNQLADIRDLILNIGKNKTVLLSTHIMQEVQAMCSSAIIIKSGQIVANNALQDIEINKEMVGIQFTLNKEIPLMNMEKIEFMNDIKSVDDYTWLVTTDQPDQFKQYLMQWAVERNIVIESLQTQKASLEDVFRSLTK